MATGGRSVVRAHGHADIRATHHKTLEVTAEGTITARATCVVGVGAELDRAGLALLRGPVRYTLRTPAGTVSGEAVVNPGHDVRERLVIRRSDHGDPDTFGLRATLAAADLPAGLKQALARPDTVVELVITEIGDRAPLVFVDDLAGAPAAGRVEALRQAGAARVLRLPSPVEPGTRVACLSGRTPGWLALVAAGLPVEPALHLGRVGRREARDPVMIGLVRSAPVPTLLTLAPDAADLLEPLAGPVALTDDVLDLGLGMRWLPPERAAATVARRADGSTVVLAARTGTGATVAVDAVAAALTAAGGSDREIDAVLRAAGVGRRERYALLGRRTLDP